MALGMGKTIVEGEVSLRFCPAQPKKVYQLNNTDLALKTTQQTFYAINMALQDYRVLRVCRY